MTDSISSLLTVLELSDSDARTTEDIFTGVSKPMPWGRIYGGQVLAQSIVAASRTVPDDRFVHSMHGYFLRPGDSHKGLTFAVDRVHDGRSFSRRRTQAFQEGVPIFSMIASFQEEDAGLEHHAPMPEGIPGPEELTSDEDVLRQIVDPSTRIDSAIDVRHVEGTLFTQVDGKPVPQQAVWMRTHGALPDDPLIQRAALAYLSDRTIQEVVLRAHGLSWTTPGLNVASLDHAMWWQNYSRVDDWLLYVQESPSARGGRGLALGRIYTRDGTLLAVVAQEIMARVPQA